MITVQKDFDDKILNEIIKHCRNYLNKTGGFDVPFLSHEVEPLSMILGPLHMKNLLEPTLLEIVVKRFIASIYHDKLSLEEISRLYLDPRIYQIYA